MVIKTSDPNSIKPILVKFNLPKANSHKGQNGRLLVIGGSSLFHSASIWAAEVASHIVDIVHYSSTVENEEIFLSLKKKFHNGIIVPQKDLDSYVKEDDAILLGPGMLRGKISNDQTPISNKFPMTNDEATYTYSLTKYLLKNFPEKRFVLDAGALQMMDREWLKKLKTPAIVTPHKKEFEELFGKEKNIEDMAREYRCVILLKAIDDVISDGQTTYTVVGGNQGLTKGGTGDILAGLTAAFYSKNDPLISAALASYILKKSSDELLKTHGIWYNIGEIIQHIPGLLHAVFSGRI